MLIVVLSLPVVEAPEISPAVLTPDDVVAGIVVVVVGGAALVNEMLMTAPLPTAITR